MNRDDIIAKLRAMKPELAQNSAVSKIALFGSLARNDARPDSDIDILIDFDKSPDIFAFIRLHTYLSETLGAKVDLVTRRALHPSLRERILREAIYV